MTDTQPVTPAAVPTASAPDPPAPASAAPGTGAGSTTPPPATPDPRDDAIRKLQSDRDRLAAENAKLKTPPPAASSEPAPGVTLADLNALLSKQGQLVRSEPTLRAEFPNADPSIFDRMLEFESPEALRAAVETSAAAFQARLDASGFVTKADHDAAIAALKAGNTPLEATTPAAPTPGGGDPVLPSAQDIAQMSWDERDAVDAKHGAGTVSRIVNAA